MNLDIPVFLDRHGRQLPRDDVGASSLRAKRRNPEFFIQSEYKNA